METRQAVHLIALAEYGNYARAAEALGITQSALTQSIARFESEVGVQLFDRGRFGATPTEAGRIVLNRARAIATEDRLALAELDAFKGATRGDLRIGVGKSVVQHLIPETLTRFARMRPDVVVTAYEGWSSDLFARLLAGDLDLVVSAAVASSPVDRDLVQHALFVQHEVVVVGTGHRLAARQDTRLADLVGERWVVPPAGTGRVRDLQATFAAAGLPTPTRFTRTDSVTMLFEMVRLGGAVGWATVELMADSRDASVVALDVPQLAAERQATITLRRRSRPTPVAALLIEEIKRIAAAGVRMLGRAS